jgi:hypothetical protein
MNPWDDELCGICYKPFSARSWENRHSVPSWHPAAGRDCHAKCCPSAYCKAISKTQAAQRKAKYIGATP